MQRGIYIPYSSSFLRSVVERGAEDETEGSKVCFDLRLLGQCCSSGQMGGAWCCGSDLAFLESTVLSLMVEILEEICQALGAVICPACFLSALQGILGLWWWWWWWWWWWCNSGRARQVQQEVAGQP